MPGEGAYSDGLSEGSETDRAARVEARSRTATERTALSEGGGRASSMLVTSSLIQNTMSHTTPEDMIHAETDPDMELYTQLLEENPNIELYDNNHFKY